jgi:glycosyltransferase involved in cell wall biosynthesis
MQRTIQNLAILIATKDRHNQLEKLLDSIVKSTYLPNKVVIVYSGKNITSVASSFQKKINLELIYSAVASQMYQKSIGITALGNTYNWVLFLDDDIVLEVNTIERMCSEYLDNFKFTDFAGFGLSILNRSTREFNSFTLRILELLKLYSNTPGSVTKSGHAQSYLDHPEEIEVKWLNGISVWQSKVLCQYPIIPSENTYSAYEDVIFSYKVGKNYKLLFAPKAKVVNQSTVGQTPLTINQFVYGGYLRYKFVSANLELSKWWLLIAQLIRGLDFTFRSNTSSGIKERMKTSLNLWVELLILALKNKNIDE